MQLPLAEAHLRQVQTDCIRSAGESATTTRSVQGTVLAASCWGSGTTSKAEQHFGAAVQTVDVRYCCPSSFNARQQCTGDVDRRFLVTPERVDDADSNVAVVSKRLLELVSLEVWQKCAVASRNWK